MNHDHSITNSPCKSALLFALLLCTLPFPLAHGQASPQDSLSLKEQFKNARRFEDLFVFTRRIEFHSVDLIGEITRVEINRKGDFLVFDQVSKKVWLFDHDGNLIRELGLEESQPGVKWFPLGAWFAQDDRILVQVNGTQNLFLFDPAGKFLKAIPVHWPPEYTDFALTATRIYGYSTQGEEPAIKVMDYDGNILFEGGVFPKKFKNYILRTSSGGLVIDPRGNIYQFNAPEPEIYKFSPDLKLLKIFKRNPPYYKRLDRDLPDFNSNPDEFMRIAGKALQEKSSTFFVHLFLDRFLLIQYLNMWEKKQIYLDICDLDGEYLTDHAINYRIHKVATFKNFVYDTYQPQETEAGEVPNPYLREYRLKVRTQ